MEHLAFTIEQVQAATGLGRTNLYAHISTGRLPAKKLGKRTLILIDDLKAFLAGLENYPARDGG
jgi:excisionase family DNA binding protein